MQYNIVGGLFFGVESENLDKEPNATTIFPFPISHSIYSINVDVREWLFSNVTQHHEK